MNNEAVNMPRTKEMILTFIRTRGPSIPVHISQYIKTSPLFASAFLSELYREQKLLMSDLKVGSTCLYLLPGQEQMLENFTQYLNQKENEAFQLIKKEKLLEDSKLPPAIRVAMREIKDFAIPLKVKSENDEKLFWKYAFLSDEEIEAILDNKPKKKPVQEPTQQVQQLQQTVQPIQLEVKVEKKSEQQIKVREIKEQKEIKEIVKIEKIEKPKKEKEKKKIQESTFTVNLKEYLTTKDIEILETIEEKAKELTAKIRINDIFGKQEYFLIAKDRKKVKEEDLTLVLHKANQNKMLALFMAPGELDKKAIDFIKEYKNLVKFEKLKF